MEILDPKSGSKKKRFIIRFKNSKWLSLDQSSMLISIFCGYSDVYVVVKGRISVTGTSITRIIIWLDYSSQKLRTHS